MSGSRWPLPLRTGGTRQPQRLFVPAETVFAQNVSPAGRTSVSTFGTVTKTTGNVNVAITGRTSSSTFGAVKANTATTVAGRTSQSTYGVTTTVGGAVTKAVAGRTSASTFGAVTTVGGPVSKAVAGRTSQSSYGTVTVTTGGVSKAVAGRTSVSSYGTVTASTTGGGTQTVNVTGRTSASTFGALSLVYNQPVVGQPATVTTTSVNLGDGFLLAKGMLFSNSIGRSFLRWANPYDLATFDTVALANDGKHNGAVGMFFDATTDLVYVCPLGYLGGDDFWHILIFTVDPDSLAVADFVDIQLYDSNVIAIGPGAGNICTDGTSLYLITHTSATFGPDTQVRKYLLADGSLTATRTITGFQHGHPIAYDSGTNKLYGGGTSPAGTGWAFSMPADLSTHSTVQVAASGCTICDDIVVRGGYFFIQDELKTGPPRFFRVKKDLSTVDVVTVGGNVAGTCDGFLDDTAVSGTLMVGIRDGNEIAVFNPDTLVEQAPLSTIGLSKINEIVRLNTSSLLVSTYEGSSKVTRLNVTTTPGIFNGRTSTSSFGTATASTTGGGGGAVGGRRALMGVGT